MKKKSKYALVQGAGGFIGSHLVRKLEGEGFYVMGVDLKYPQFSETYADTFLIRDLRDQEVYDEIYDYGAIEYDEVYQLAADMGGAGFIFTGENDAQITHNNAMINLNTAEACIEYNVKKIFYSSSACVYPDYNQVDPDNPNCSEESAYPAAPDSAYGWEKLFSEIMFLSYAKNLDLDVRIARFHNIFGPEGTWRGGREKAPAAICRKVAEASGGDSIDVWGDGKQTRSFLFIDECLNGVRKLMDSDFKEPLNIGSDEIISINDLAKMVIKFSGKDIKIEHIEGPLGVRGRNSDNNLIKKILGWSPTAKLEDGMRATYQWVEKQIK